MVKFEKDTENAIKAAHSVLIEVTRLLGEYKENIVLVGGWVPELLISNEHVGSLDVDLAFNHSIMKEKFSSPQKSGPSFVADFEAVRNEEERAILKRDAYERVCYLVDKIIER